VNLSAGAARQHTQPLLQLQQQQQQPLLSLLPAMLLSRQGMATRVEQQQAANPGASSVLCVHGHTCRLDCELHKIRPAAA
jgi:hypothetical protein